MLSEKYRPKAWPDFVGQDKAVTRVKAILGLPSFDRGAFLLTGPSGAGKTSLARVVARHLGCNDWSTVEIKGQDCSVDSLRKLATDFSYMPLTGTWKVAIVNECHNMTSAAREYALDFMEAPPENRAVILTTTEADWCEERLFSRFYTVRFAKPNADLVTAHLQRIAKREGFDVSGLNLKRFVQDRHNNIRLILMDLEIEVAVALAA